MGAPKHERIRKDSQSEMYGSATSPLSTHPNLMRLSVDPQLQMVVADQSETKTGNGEADDDLPPSPHCRADSEHSNAVFGAPPLLLASTMCVDRDYGAPIPNVLSTLRDALWANDGRLTPNIFRTEGDSDTVRVLARRLDHGELFSIDFAEVDAYSIASLLKLWFASLPQRVLDDVEAKVLVGCKNMKVAGSIVEAEMGEPFETYFKWLLDVCLEVTKHEKVNGMAIKHLAMVMAPCLRSKQREKVNLNVVKFVQLSILWRHFTK